MDRNADLFELLYVNESNIMEMVDELTRLARITKPTGPLDVWETFGGTGRHSLDFALRDTGQIRTSFTNQQLHDWTRDQWAQAGYLDRLKLSPLKVGDQPDASSIDLAFCAYPDLFRIYLTTVGQVKDHFVKVADKLKVGGHYIVSYGELADSYPVQLKTTRKVASNRVVKAIMTFKDKKRDWIKNTLHAFMTITAEHSKSGSEAIKPIANDVVFGLHTLGDYCRMAKESGFSGAAVYLWGGYKPVDTLLVNNTSPFLVLIR